MTYVYTDFGLEKTGPQFGWLDQRLTVHRLPPTRLMMTLKDRVQAFQLRQGWTGGSADGLIGPETLRRLTLDPPGTDLKNWKLTLPIGEDEHPLEVFPIGSYSNEYFRQNPDGTIKFRCPVTGVTTSGSGYPRSELREMDGTAKAEWGNGSGLHTLKGGVEVYVLPEGKREVVVAQIHDPYDDVVMLLVTVEGVYASWSKYPNSGSERVQLLSGDWRGRRLDYLISASPTIGVKVDVNGRTSQKSKTISKAYFKFGLYLQANESNGTGYGEALHYPTELSHAA